MLNSRLVLNDEIRIQTSGRIMNSRKKIRKNHLKNFARISTGPSFFVVFIPMPPYFSLLRTERITLIMIPPRRMIVVPIELPSAHLAEDSFV